MGIRTSDLLTWSSPGTIESPIEEISETNHGEWWIVTVFDNDTNSIDEVVSILILATRCSTDEAVMETWEIHNLGKSVVHHASEAECNAVAGIISVIGIHVEVSQE